MKNAMRQLIHWVMKPPRTIPAALPIGIPND
jgi:hypothetical protein